MPGDKECTKPPLGIAPRRLWVKDRLKSIDQAINRRVFSNHDIPVEWIQERKEHIEYLNNTR